MTHLEELRQQEQDVLEDICTAGAMAGPQWEAQMLSMLRAIRTELALVEQTKAN